MNEIVIVKCVHIFLHKNIIGSSLPTWIKNVKILFQQKPKQTSRALPEFFAKCNNNNDFPFKLSHTPSSHSVKSE